MVGASDLFRSIPLLGNGLGFLDVVVLVGPDLLPGGLAVNFEAASLLASVAYASAGVYGGRFSGLPVLMAATLRRLSSHFALRTLGRSAIAVTCAACGRVPNLFPACRARWRDQLVAGHISAANHLAAAGSMLLGEAIMPEALAGMALIGLGLAVIDGRLVPRLALRSG